MSPCKCRTLAAFTMTPEEREVCRRTCRAGFYFGDRVRSLTEYLDQELAGAAGLEPATPSLEGSCSDPTELRTPASSDSTPLGGAEAGAHAAQGDPARGHVIGLSPLETRAGDTYRGDSIARLEQLAGRAISAAALSDAEDLGDVSDHHFRAVQP
jgi:hypothetical protein